MQNWVNRKKRFLHQEDKIFRIPPNKPCAIHQVPSKYYRSVFLFSFGEKKLALNLDSNHLSFPHTQIDRLISLNIQCFSFFFTNLYEGVSR